MTVKTFQEQFITDRAGRKTHVILPMELYERVRALLDDSDFQIVETWRKSAWRLQTGMRQRWMSTMLCSSLPDKSMAEVDECLRASLGIS